MWNPCFSFLQLLDYNRSSSDTMKDLSNTNPQQPRKSCMQEPITEERKKGRGERIALRICKTILSNWKENNENYKRSILEEEDQKPNKNLRAKLQLKEVI